MRPTPRTTLAVCFSAMLVVGILSGALGPFIPELAGRLRLPAEALGPVFTALFLGALLTQLTGGWLAERFGFHNLAVAGVALLTAGIVGITVSPALALILASAFLAGAGQGLLDVGSNVIVSTVFHERAAVSAVNVLHFAFGAGAVVSPLLTRASVAAWATPMPVLWLGAALGVATLLASTRWLMDAAAPREAAGEGGGGALYRSPVLWLLGLILLLYMGVETGLGGWTTIYVGETTTLSPGAIALLLSGFWLALTAGRLVGAALGTRLGAGDLALASVVGSSAGGLMVVAGVGSATWTIAGTVLMGVSFGPLFPSVVVMGTKAFRAAPGRAASIIISMSSLGAMVLPVLQGVLLERVSPASSVALVAAACLGMLALLLAIRRLSAQPSRGEVQRSTR
jgi:fucose permease